MLDKNILNICDFFEQHCDFFSSNFIKDERFKAFLNETINNTTVNDLLTSLDTALCESFSEQAKRRGGFEPLIKNDYRKAIVGNEKPGIGIVYGDKKTLYKFFERNRIVLNFFLQEITILTELSLLWKKFINKDIKPKNSGFSFFSMQFDDPKSGFFIPSARNSFN